MEEQQAVARLKRGDLSGLEALVRAHQLRAVRAAYLIVRDRPQAEDIVQAAFVRSAERIAQFDERRPFGPWFLTGVVHDAIKVAAQNERHISLEWEPSGDGSALADRLLSAAPDPPEAAEAAETEARVWDALGRLSATQRAAVVMRYYLGMSEAEMAIKLNAAPGTVKWHLHRARERLRTLLRSLWSERDNAEKGVSNDTTTSQ